MIDMDLQFLLVPKNWVIPALVNKLSKQLDNLINELNRL